MMCRGNAASVPFNIDNAGVSLHFWHMYRFQPTTGTSFEWSTPRQMHADNAAGHGVVYLIIHLLSIMAWKLP